MLEFYKLNVQPKKDNNQNQLIVVNNKNYFLKGFILTGFFVLLFSLVSTRPAIASELLKQKKKVVNALENEGFKGFNRNIGTIIDYRVNAPKKRRIIGVGRKLGGIVVDTIIENPILEVIIPVFKENSINNHENIVRHFDSRLLKKIQNGSLLIPEKIAFFPNEIPQNKARVLINKILQLRGGFIGPEMLKTLVLGKGADFVKKNIKKFLFDSPTDEEIEKPKDSNKPVKRLSFDQIRIFQGLGIFAVISIIIGNLTGRQNGLTKVLTNKVEHALEIVFPAPKPTFTQKILNNLESVRALVLDPYKPYVYVLTLLFIYFFFFYRGFFGDGKFSDIQFMTSSFKSVTDNLANSMKESFAFMRVNQEKYQNIHEKQCRANQDKADFLFNENSDLRETISENTIYQNNEDTKLHICYNTLENIVHENQAYQKRLTENPTLKALVTSGEAPEIINAFDEIPNFQSDVILKQIKPGNGVQKKKKSFW